MTRKASRKPQTRRPRPVPAAVAPSTTGAARPLPVPAFRSGVVARMAAMPVSTLRIWEQRYRAVEPVTAPSGHRLYSSADVQRVLMLRQLTEQGHAIGTIAPLSDAQLQDVARAHPVPHRSHPAPGDGPEPARRTPAVRLVVVGRALALRLQRPGVHQRLARPVRIVAVFDTLEDAAAAATVQPVDALLWQSPGLPAGIPPSLGAARDAWHASQVAVLYRFASSAARKALVDSGDVVIREPADDDALGAWLVSLQAAEPAATARSEAGERTAAGVVLPDRVPPRRFDDATLTTITGLSTTIACECPQHVAELVMQLSSFESYSSTCSDRSPADAEIHAFLGRVAAASRALFESALERVARYEGLTLPKPLGGRSSAPN